MAKKGQQYTSPPKRFHIPADYKPLGNSGTHLIHAVRVWVSSINRRVAK